MFIQGSDCDSNTNQVLRKPEVDAFLATAISPELYNVNYLAGLKLEMVTIRGVHLAALFMQVTFKDFSDSIVFANLIFLKGSGNGTHGQ